ncbi:glutaredoxin family protein [Pseudoduganella sp. OTU4001]|uniref:glutaredoxin family protein n=1 Tax=Pseudoduganella sp. OTU4001 TaxID=3043854 RepID=UPI00313CEF9E
MKRAALLLLLLTASAAHAQMYKWKDDKGVTHFTDTPPPASAKKAEVKSYSGGGTGSVELPSELAEIARARPVVLYTTASCAPCDQARQLLLTRGIPYREKTVASQEDHEALRKAGSNGELPMMLVGRARQVGFEPGTWDSALTDAGYPTVKALPAGYSNPPPSPAAPPRPPSASEAARAKAEAANAAAEAERERRERETPQNAPSNFRF